MAKRNPGNGGCASKSAKNTATAKERVSRQQRVDRLRVLDDVDGARRCS